jgi:hypothetical protein
MVTGNLGKRKNSGFNTITCLNQIFGKELTMKILLLLLIIMNIGFAQEFKVDGNLKVTGTVESTTIDSLKQVIAKMHAHADNQLETRVYALPRFNFSGETTMDLDISQITGFDLDYCLLKMVHTTAVQTATFITTINLRHYLTLPDGNTTSLATHIDLYSDGTVAHGQFGYLKYTSGKIVLEHAEVSSDYSGYVDIILSVTAQFPD